MFGLKNGVRVGFAAHLTGITLMIAGVTQSGSPSGLWILMAGAATLAVGNGMIEVARNPLVAALHPEAKTTHLNWFHARIADRYLADALPAQQTLDVLTRAQLGWPVTPAGGRMTDAATLGFRPSDIQEALTATAAALAAYRASGDIRSDETANALRAIAATRLAQDPWLPKRRGGYRAVRLERAVSTSQ